MKRKYDLYVADMLSSIEHIQQYVSGLGYDEFCADQKTIDAVLRNLEIIGEAAKHIPEELKQLHNSIPWSLVVGFRNVAAHKYWVVDTEIVWDIIQNKLSDLEVALREIDLH